MHERNAITWTPGAVLAGLLVLLPIMSAVPLGGMSSRMALTASPHYLYTVGILALFAGWIAAQDRWMGLLTGWVGLSLLWTPTVAGFETAETLVLSACAVMIVRHLSPTWRAHCTTGLVVMGLFQVLYGVQQWLGYDVLWHGLQPIIPIQAMIGTTGNSNYYGVYLAMIAPLAPWWAVPIFLMGIALSHSLVAVAAVCAGLLWRVRHDQGHLGIGLALTIGFAAAVLTLKGPTPLSGMAHRLEVWQLAVQSLTWKGWLIGVGPGSWAQTVPGLQVALGIYPNEVFLQGHNEWLQFLYEYGLVGVGCLAGWLWAHRRAWTGPSGPSCLAVGICSLGMFPLHLAMTGCVALVILGLATAKECDV